MIVNKFINETFARQAMDVAKQENPDGFFRVNYNRDSTDAGFLPWMLIQTGCASCGGNGWCEQCDNFNPEDDSYC